jgi:hypothetical protein
MPIYEFKTEDGRTVERMFKMSERPTEITLEDGTVAKIIISQIAKMASNWEVKGTTSDLPDEDTDAS